MPRVFVYHDKDGKILSIAAVEAMHGELPHPFFIEDPEHGVIEADANHPALVNGLDYAHDNARVDVETKTLIAPDAAKRAGPPGRKRARS